MKKSPMAKLTKEQKEFQRKRAKWEFEIRLWEFIREFKSKEEPSVKLNTSEIIEIFSENVSKYLKQNKI